MPSNVPRADKLSPFKFYQHLLTNVADAEAGKFLRMLTFLPLEEIAEIEKAAAASGGAGAAQRRLAEEVTRFVHGEEGLQQALAATQAGFKGMPAAWRATSRCRSIAFCVHTPYTSPQTFVWHLRVCKMLCLDFRR